VGVTFKPANTVEDNIQITRVQARRQNWFEITNNGTVALSTRGLYLSDNYDEERSELGIRAHDFRWRMPAIIIQPGQTVFFSTANTFPGQYVNEIMKNTTTNFSPSFGERLRIGNRRGDIVQHVDVALMRDNQAMNRGSDGVWRVTSDTNGRMPPPFDPGCGFCGTCDDCRCPTPNQRGRACRTCPCPVCFPNGPCTLTSCQNCHPGPQIGRPIVTGNIEGVIVTNGGRNVEAVGMPSHGAAINFVVEIRLEGPFNMSGFSAPPGIRWSVADDILTIRTDSGATVQWGSGLGSMW